MIPADQASEPVEPFTLDPLSAKKIVGDAKEIMLYGFAYAHYIDVARALSDTVPTVKKVFDYTMGNSNERLISEETGRSIAKLRYKSMASGHDAAVKRLARICKSGLVNLVFENYKRQKRYEPIIPLIFCIDSNTKKVQEYSSLEGITSCDASLKKVITYKELRRLAKLCFTLRDSDDPELKELSEVARQTLKMVRVDVDASSGAHVLKEVPSPWDDPKWEEKWDERIQKKHAQTSKEYEQVFSKIGWRRELSTLIKEFKKEIEPYTEQDKAILRSLHLSQEDLRKVYITLRKIYKDILEKQPAQTFYPTFSDFMDVFSPTKNDTVLQHILEAKKKKKISQEIDVEKLFQTPIQEAILTPMYERMQKEQHEAIALKMKQIALQCLMIMQKDSSKKLSYADFKERFSQDFAKDFIESLEESFPKISQTITAEKLLDDEVIWFVSERKPALKVLYKEAKKLL